MNTPKEIAADVAAHPYAWPGGYNRYAITDDGGALCKDCCGSQAQWIDESDPGDGWHVIAADINYEDISLHCDHCSALIEASYGDDDTT